MHAASKKLTLVSVTFATSAIIYILFRVFHSGTTYSPASASHVALAEHIHLVCASSSSAGLVVSILFDGSSFERVAMLRGFFSHHGIASECIFGYTVDPSAYKKGVTTFNRMPLVLLPAPQTSLERRMVATRGVLQHFLEGQHSSRRLFHVESLVVFWDEYLD